MPVAQGRGFVILQHHRSRGGYSALKQIEAFRYEGTTDVGDQSYRLNVNTQRPYQYERIVGDGENESVTSWDGANVSRQGSLPDLPAAYQDEFLSSYEFDGWMTDWKDKGHQVWRLGMKKIGEKLPWLMEAELANGRTWHIYVDSHTGDAFRSALIDADGNEKIRIEYADYKEVDGFRLPHQVRYFQEENLLAIDRYTRITVGMTAKTLEAATIQSAGDTT